MKKRLLTIALLLLSVLLVFAACDNTNSGGEVVVEINEFNIHYRQGSFFLTDEDADSFDFSKLFVVTEGEKSIAVTKDMLDLSQLDKDGGQVVCTYAGKSATANVVIQQTVYELQLTKYQLTIAPSDVANYDFKSLFRATVNGDVVDVSDDMVVSNVTNTEGDYTYTVNFHGLSQTINVRVQDIYVITVSRTALTLESKNFDSYNFLSLFSATKNGKPFQLTEDNLDFSDCPRWSGKGTLVCKAGNYSKSVDVTVTPNEYLPGVRMDSMSISLARVATYDFTSLFSLKIDGESVTVTPDMISGTVQAKAGEYTLSLTVNEMSVSVRVTVLAHEVVNLVKCYPNISLSLAQAKTFDATRLFSLYVDEVAVPVTADMIDDSQLKNAMQNGVVSVSFSYKLSDNTVFQETASVTIADQTLTVAAVAPTVEVYPNSVPLNLASLFVIVDNGKDVEVTMDMIDGTVNYTKSGDYVITCTYEGVSATATVSVKDGVVIVTQSDVVEVKAGTDIATYNFANDFTMVVNGITFTNVDRYITFDGGKTVAQLEDPTFLVGDYNVTLTVNYNDKTVSSTGNVAFTKVSKTIVYRVVANTYVVQLDKDVVSLEDPSGFDVFSNVKVYLNGQALSKKLVDSPDKTDAMSLYADVKTQFNPNLSWQTVEMDIYVNGVGYTPVHVKYEVEIKDRLEIVAHDQIVFSGETLYTTDLFEIYQNGEIVTVLPQYVSGKVDVFNAGVYHVTISYGDVTKTARVTVLDRDLIGSYLAATLTVATESSEDSDGYVTDATNVRRYGDFVVNADGTVVLCGTAGYISVANDDTIHVKVGNFDYYLYYEDGVVVLEYVNALHMRYSEDGIIRSLVYVSKDKYTVSAPLQINNQSTHVIQADGRGYFTLEVAKITDKKTKDFFWYGLKVTIKETIGSDVYYLVDHGKVTLPDGFDPRAGAEATYNFKGEQNKFAVGDDEVMCRISDDKSKINVFAGNYTGTYNSQRATLDISSLGGATFKIAGKTEFEASYLDVSSMHHGGSIESENIFFAYRAYFGQVETHYYSYKFVLDTTNKTFTVVEKDNLFGYYACGDKYFFLDGYGSGVAHLEGSNYDLADLVYSLENGELNVDFVDTNATFNYGTSATFYMSQLLNTLTVKKLGDGSLDGQKFVNTQIVDGAVVNVNTFTFPVQATNKAPEEFYSSIDVVTKDGSWTLEEKKNSANVATKTICWNKAGVYRYSIKVKVNGQSVLSYFTVEVLAEIYKDSPFVGNYVNSFGGEVCTLELTKNGVATLKLSDRTYTGLFDVYGDKAIVKVSAVGYAPLTFEVTMPVAHTVTFKLQGIGTVFASRDAIAQTGAGAVTLTRVSDGEGGYAYFLTNGFDTKLITPTFDDNKVVLTVNGKQVLYRIDSWAGATSGLTQADGLQGVYIGIGSKDIKLDGFGVLTISGSLGSYTICRNNSLFVTIDGINYAFQLGDGVYSEIEIPTPQQLVAGNTFSGDVLFNCDTQYNFTAQTTFVFDLDGGVTVLSTSSMHDDGDYACENDVYNCPLVNKAGTYVASGRSIVVTIGEYTMTFTFDDPLYPTKIVCFSSNMTKEIHGGVTEGCTFVLQ